MATTGYIGFRKNLPRPWQYMNTSQVAVYRGVITIFEGAQLSSARLSPSGNCVFLRVLETDGTVLEHKLFRDANADDEIPRQVLTGEFSRLPGLGWLTLEQDLDGWFQFFYRGG